MSIYYVNPEIKIRQESWGGFALTVSGKLIIINSNDMFETLASFSLVELDDSQLPGTVEQLIKLGLITKREDALTENVLTDREYVLTDKEVLTTSNGLGEAFNNQIKYLSYQEIFTYFENYGTAKTDDQGKEPSGIKMPSWVSQCWSDLSCWSSSCENDEEDGAGKKEWLIGMSSEFRKSIKVIDKKTQGRILEAIASLSKDPLSVRGDTVKPLSSNLNGLWRYRIGDFRLLYFPDADKSNIVLLEFSNREDVYRDK